MAITLLQLVDRVSGELGLAQPSIVIGSGLNQTMQLLALTQSLGEDLNREFEWQRSVRAYIFQTTAAQVFPGCTLYGSTLVNGAVSTGGLTPGMVISGSGIAPYAEIVSISSGNEFVMNVPATSGTGSVPVTSTLTFAVQDYALPADYNRMISDTNWDRTNHWRNLGPKSSQEWQTLQGGVISTGPRERFRVVDNKLRFFPAPTAAYNEAFEYVSNYWVIAAAGTTATKESFTVDSDTCIFPDALMRAGLKYYFLNAKKLECGVEQKKFEDLKAMAKAQDQPVSMQSLTPVDLPMLIGPWSVPDGSWQF